MVGGDKKHPLHVQAPNSLANMHGRSLNPRETLRSIPPLSEHLEVTSPWQGLLEGATSTAGTWEQLGAGDRLAGDGRADQSWEG